MFISIETSHYFLFTVSLLSDDDMFDDGNT